jgi:hypothetical protein
MRSFLTGFCCGKRKPVTMASFNFTPEAGYTDAVKPEIIISLDYDGCGDVIFLKEPRFVSMQRRNPAAYNCFKEESAFFLAHLSTLTMGKRCELYVGSSRQDCQSDKENQAVNRTGSCFDNFRVLAKALDWNFNELLLSDFVEICRKNMFRTRQRYERCNKNRGS